MPVAGQIAWLHAAGDRMPAVEEEDFHAAHRDRLRGS
jgi:hypothetical protein